MTCLTSEKKCRGELIEKFRYWIVQMAMMDKILGICKDNDYTALKSIVQESGLSLLKSFIVYIKFGSAIDCFISFLKLITSSEFLLTISLISEVIIRIEAFLYIGR